MFLLVILILFECYFSTVHFKYYEMSSHNDSAVEFFCSFTVLIPCRAFATEDFKVPDKMVGFSKSLARFIITQIVFDVQSLLLA